MKLRNVITKEICEAEAREDGIYVKANWSDEEKWFLYDLETLARGWEYYVVPAEPLIKDEKIRKAVRAWADGNECTNVQFDAYWKGFRHNNSTITVWNDLPLEDGATYTITELCGEEEE